MKTQTLALITIVLGIGFLCANAQQASSTGSTQSPDSIVALAADSQSLPPVAPSNVPARGGTYWWVYPGGIAVPSPMLPLGTGEPIYGITTQEFLVDLTGGSVVVTPHQLAQESQTTNAYASAVETQVQDLINLITWVQTPTPSTEATSSANFKPGPLGGGGFSPDYSTANGPYLTIMPTATNQFLVTVYNNTSPAIYELWWTPALADSNYPWQQLVIGASGQTNFTVNNVYPNGFFRAIWDTNGVPTSGLVITIDSPLNGTVFH